MAKIQGIKKAVGDYKKANEEGNYSPRYGYLMYNVENGEIWTDEFYSLGHSNWEDYENKAIINIGKIMEERGIAVTMKNVKAFVEENFK